MENLAAKGAVLMKEIIKRNRLLPWYLGLAITLGCVAFVGGRMYAGECPAPVAIELGVLLVIPVVYLVLMYLTFTSQE
jgi:hypothetical protein